MTNQLTHIADVKVGRVKGNSRMYPQLRLPSQYVELAGKKASIYEIDGHDGGPSFIIRFDNSNNVAAYHGEHIPKGVWPTGAKCPLSPVEASNYLHQRLFLSTAGSRQVRSRMK